MLQIGKYTFSKGQVIGAGVFAALVVCGLVVLGVYKTTRNEGRTLERTLSSEFQSTQARYGQFRLGAADLFGIVHEQAAKMDQILRDSSTGRYDVKDAEGKPTGEVDQKLLFLAIKEAYPDLKSLSESYDKILTYVQAGRQRFAKDQETLADMVRSYNTWRTTGAIYHPTVVGWVGFPSDALEVRIGDKVLNGQAALDKMSEVFIGTDAVKIFETGKDQSLVPPSK